MHVYLSYSAEKDKDLVKKITQCLRESNFEVWSAANIIPGENWAEVTSQALKKSDAMVVLLNEESVNSHQVRNDIAYALGGTTFSGRLIPVITSESVPMEKIPWILRGAPFELIRLPSNGSRDDGIKQIINTLKKNAA